MSANPAERPAHLEVELHVRALLDDEGIAQPDEVKHLFDPDEIVLLWTDTKLAVTVELEGGVPRNPRV